MSKLSELQPRLVWEFFEQITQVPRPSKHEEKIRQYLVDYAIRAGLEHNVDQTGNVLIVKPASKGMESAPAVVLQSHMDMVCEKNSDVKFDFMTDPIRVKTDGDWVRAEGTTLGADCGIGMAAALAVLEDKTLTHGKIEALFTVDEETGLTGAFGLAPGMLEGKYLINLDSEDEGEIFIGCAGGVDTVATFKPLQEHANHELQYFRVAVSGLRGGHSGDNINDGLGNANKLLARILWQATLDFGVRLGAIDGGNLRNAIPREAWAVVGVGAKHVPHFRGLFDRTSADCRAEYALTEPDMAFTLTEAKAADAGTLMDVNTQRALLGAIRGVANGVLAMSRAMPGLVETSTNLASVKRTAAGHIDVVSSQRSSVESAKWDAAHTVEAIFRLAGAEVIHSDGYPGWAPNPDSHLLKVSVECYKKLFGTEPKVRAIHAGLECGLFLEKYPDLEMVSFGPTLRGVHSPDERMEIATVDKFWRLLVELLKELKK